jgi:hypothetical protein
LAVYRKLAIEMKIKALWLKLTIMPKYLFIFLPINIFLICSSIAQIPSNSQKPIQLITGVKYVTLDYIGGPVIGLKYHLKNDQSIINLRKDIVLAMGTDQNSRSFCLSRYRTYSYLEYGHKVKGKTIISAGIAWVYRGEGSVEWLNFQSGYQALTISISYPIDFLHIEVRADIPLEKDDIVFKGHAFPLSVAILFPFKT